jgi:uncharacterized membrane protein
MRRRSWRPVVLKLLALLAIVAAIVLLFRRQMKQAARRRRHEDRERRLEIQQQRWDEAMGETPEGKAEAAVPPADVRP